MTVLNPMRVREIASGTGPLLAVIQSGTGPLLAVIQSGTGPLLAEISGQTVNVSVTVTVGVITSGRVRALVSGDMVNVSGQPVVVTSGQVMALVSGQPVVVTSGQVMALVSGPVTANQGGAWGIQVSGAIRVSGAMQVSGIVDIETPTSIVNFQQAILASGVQLSGVAVKSVTIKAMSTNSGLIYLGTSGVLPTTGFELDDGEAVDLDIDNTSRIYGIATVSGDRVCVLGVA